MSTDARWTATMPATYDHLLGPVLFAPFAEVLVDRVLDGGGRALEVLELAAGTGVLTRALLHRLPVPTRVTATDLNPAMVAEGARRAPGAHWLPADAARLPAADGSFDLVVCAFGVMFLPDPVEAFREAHRVLAPGGRVVFSVWDRWERCSVAAALVRALRDVLPDDPPDFVARVPHGYSDPGRIRTDLAAAGLAPGTVESVTLPVRAPSAESVAEGFCRGTPLRFALEGRGDLAALTARIAHHMTDELGQGPITGPMTALLVDAGRPR